MFFFKNNGYHVHHALCHLVEAATELTSTQCKTLSMSSSLNNVQHFSFSLPSLKKSLSLLLPPSLPANKHRVRGDRPVMVH